jgi:hypothetical protein
MHIFMFDEIPSFYYIHLQRISKNDVFAES